MSYRDDLNSAQQRIAALERELASYQKEDDSPRSVEPHPLEYNASSFQQLINEYAARSRPLVKPLQVSAKPVTYLFSAQGEAGQTVHVIHKPWRTFRAEELFAFDTSSHPGHGTVISRVFVGAESQFSDIPTWMFYEWVPESERAAMRAATKLCGTTYETEDTRAVAAKLRILDAAMRFKWVCSGGLDITFSVTFRETCKWEAVLLGTELR